MQPATANLSQNAKVQAVSPSSTEETLKTSLALLQQIVDHLPQAIGWKDKDAVFLGCNQAFAQAVGLTHPDEIVGKAAIDVQWQDHQSDFLYQHDRSLIEQQQATYHQMEVLPHAEQPLSLDVSCIPLYDERSDVAGILTVIEAATDHKQVEESLQLTQFAVDHAADAIWWVEIDSTIAYINDAGCRDLGYARDEILGRKVWDFNPDILEATWADQWQMIKTLGSYTFETHNRHRDGTSYPVEVAINYIELNGKEYQCAFVRNIAERKRSEAERKQAEDALKLTQFSVDRAADPIWWVELDGTLFYVNDAACRDLGYAREAILGKRVFDFNPDLPIDGWAAHWQELKERGSFTFETRNQNSRGTIYPVEVTVNYIELNGKELNCAIARNITERKQTEAALRESEQQMREQAQRERLLNRLLSRVRDSLDFDIILETTLQEVQNFTNADRCQFSWYDANNDESYWEVIKEARCGGLPSLVDRYPVSPTSPLLVKLQELQILRVEDAETLAESSLLRFVNKFGYRAMLAIPIQVRPGLLGTIFCCHSTETRSWSDSEIELIQAVMSQLAIAITQADLYNQSRTKAQALEQALRELQKTQTQMVQSEKMSSLGQLVAGVAHEINNPVNFIYGNLTHASSYTQDLLHLIKLYQQHYPNPVPTIQAEADAIDLDFLLDDLPKLLSSMKVGADRIQKIVLSLRNFSRMDEADVKQVDIHEGIDSTLMILQSRLKGKAGESGIAIVKHYGQLPQVECYPGQLNQVFMNLLVNAIDALEESSFDLSDRQPTIHIQTEQSTHQAAIVIKISDNGCGMTQAQQQRLFDPFFTTKAVGKGTGLGLSISYQIVVDKHGGALTCFSAQGKGTEFCIEIPVERSTN
ncbi:MAG: PAS domain S-box protein [Tildeniella nuda ZEHNDER 1965/U140]|jgi:PAS domain S-box-containing protein|nr:PAS domain S-box protein [Tildeniella nuda ZEHNDER 1965/U140]